MQRIKLHGRSDQIIMLYTLRSGAALARSDNKTRRAGLHLSPDISNQRFQLVDKHYELGPRPVRDEMHA